jgi:EmrB/QacA subfamily drug resistance transporter
MTATEKLQLTRRFGTAERGANVLLVLLCLAQFMVVLDVSVVNVALPAIRRGVGFSATDLQWVINAYTLTFAGFLMLGGRAADLLGRRRVFLAGIALFTLASLACALSDSKALLLTARAVQGVGAAVVSPASLSIIATSFEAGPERNRALGVWGAMAGLGAAAGVLLGGVLTQTLGWWSIFAVNIPVGAAVVFLGRSVIPEGRREDAVRHFDLSGALLVTGGLTALTYGIVRSDALGWGSLGVLGPIAGGVALLVAFLVVEGRIAVAPLVPLSIFKLRLLRAGNLVVFLLYSSILAMFFFTSVFMQQVLGFSAIQAGLGFAPMTLFAMTGSTFAPRLVARFGARSVVTVGMLISAGGMALLSGMAPGQSYFTHVLPGGVMTTLGLGLSLVPSTIKAVQGVPPQQSGLASALINTSRFVGGAIGLAVLGTIAEAHTKSSLRGGASSLKSITDGYQLGFEIAVLFCLAGALVAAVMLRERPEPVAVVAPEAVREDVERAAA